MDSACQAAAPLAGPYFASPVPKARVVRGQPVFQCYEYCPVGRAGFFADRRTIGTQVFTMASVAFVNSLGRLANGEGARCG